MALEVGHSLPDFTLPATDGRLISPASLKGRKAVLYFYPKDDTSGCTQEARDFQRLKAEFAAAETEIVGISPDPVKKHDKFRKKYELDIALASDEPRALIEGLGLWVEKTFYGRKYMGVERTTILLDRDGKIAKIWAKVNVPGHADEVLATTRAL